MEQYIRVGVDHGTTVSTVTYHLVVVRGDLSYAIPLRTDETATSDNLPRANLIRASGAVAPIPPRSPWKLDWLYHRSTPTRAQLCADRASRRASYHARAHLHSEGKPRPRESHRPFPLDAIEAARVH